MSYLHGERLLHGDLIPEFVCITEKDEYKLIPQIQVKTNKKYKIAKYQESLKSIYQIKPNIHKNDQKEVPPKKQEKNKVSLDNSSKLNSQEFIFTKTYSSPEVYLNEKSRVAYKRLVIDKNLSETFSLGMLLLSVGLLENLDGFYKLFIVDKNFLQEKLIKFESLHGRKLFSVLCKLLEIDSEKRSTLDTALDYLRSEQEIFHSPSLFSNDSKPSPRVQLKHSKSIKKINKPHAFSSDYEDNTESSLIHKLFNQLPQEYQDEIDKKISEQMRIIEDEKYPTDMYISGNRYQGQKEDEIPHGWGIYWWANGERYEGLLIMK